MNSVSNENNVIEQKRQTDICSKNNFLESYYNIVKVVSNNSVIFTRFSYLVIVYICPKAFNFSLIKDKTRHQKTDTLQQFLVVNTSECN